MIPRDDDQPADGGGEGALARLAEQVTRRLQAGDPARIADDLGRDPSRAGPILDLLPTLRDLADLGARLARDRRSRRVPGPTDDALPLPSNPEDDR